MVYFQSLLRYIGCNIETHLLAAVFGDELTLRTDLIHADNNSLDFLRQAVQAIRSANPSNPPVQMLQAITQGMMEADQFSKEFYAGHCEVAERLAERLGFDKPVVAAIKQVYARWDGKGIPALKGEAIAPGMLVVSLAQDAVYMLHLGGVEMAVNLVQQRKGTLYAPQHVDLFCLHAREILAGTEMRWKDILALEPEPQKTLTEDELERACQAMADFVDMKSPYLLGHSPGVARIAEGAAQQYRLPAAEVTELRRAALLHDLGRVGVSAGIWGKQEPLTDRDWEKIRLHPYHTERILSYSPALSRLARIASMHHERLDGSGYHRNAIEAMQTPAVRLLAAADVYQALTEPRPHRPALTPEMAAEILRSEVKAGRLDGEATNCVLAAMGEQRSTKKQFAGGLSEREVEVLRLIARGHSIKDMAGRLVISPKTVDSHIQHIYNKIGVGTRAGATLYAMEHNLL